MNVYINIYVQSFHLGMAIHETATVNQMRLPKDFWAFNFELR